MNKSGAVGPTPDLSWGAETLRFLAAPGDVLLFMLDAQGRCEFVSPSWLELTGRTLAQEVGGGWLERIHPEDRPVLESGLQAAMCEVQALRQLFRIESRDGVCNWFVSQGMPRTDPAGVLTGYIGVCFDVTTYQEEGLDTECNAQRMIALLRHTRLIAMVLDHRGHVQYSNGSLCRLLQYSGVELMDYPVLERLAAPGSRALLDTLFPKGEQATHFPGQFEMELLTRSGQSRMVDWHAVVLRDRTGNPRNTILIGDDITELRQTEAQTAMSAKIFDATHHAMLVTTLDGTIVAVNSAFTLLTGYSREESLGQNPRMLQSGRHDADFYAQLWRHLLATGHWCGDVWDRRKDGGIYPKYLSISVVRNASGEATHYSGIFYDVSERKTVEERLDQLAHYDVLTALPNRSLLLDRLEQSIERANRQQCRVGLLYLDLDYFKQVNDTLGHAAGDVLLKEVAQRMRSCLRSVDTAARMGGDEFVVLVPDVGDRSDLDAVAQKLVEALAPVHFAEGHPVSTQASIGISVYPDDAHDVQELLRHADAAMYLAKQGGRGTYRFFAP